MSMTMALRTLVLGTGLVLLTVACTTGAAPSPTSSGTPTTPTLGTPNSPTIAPAASSGEPSASLSVDRILVLTTLADRVVAAGGTQTVVGDITQQRNLDWAFQQHATDSRLDGTTHVTINVDLRLDRSAEMWGTLELTNAGGTWSGPWTGTIAKGQTTHYLLGTAAGSGAYAGLAWRWQGYFLERDEGFSPTTEVVTTGWIAPTSSAPAP